MLGKRFYVLLAKNFRTRRPPVNSVQYPVWRDMVHLTADSIEGTTSGFNREKFLEAAGDQAALALAE